MSVVRRFRDWWQPPRRAGDRPEVTFLELLYKLVYVEFTTQLSHTLVSNLNWAWI